MILAVLAVIVMVPIIMMVLGSFKTQTEAGQFNLALPTEFHPENYLYVLEKGKILNGYKNSLLVTVPATFFTIVFGALAGIVLSDARAGFPAAYTITLSWPDDHPADSLHLCPV